MDLEQTQPQLTDMFQEFSYKTTNNMAEARKELVGMDQQFPEFHNRVRFDAATRKGSVLDVIHVMTGQAKRHCCTLLNSLSKAHPELTSRFQKIKIENKVKHKIFREYLH
jgi:hypothetical protein